MINYSGWKYESEVGAYILLRYDFDLDPVKVGY